MAGGKKIAGHGTADILWQTYGFNLRWTEKVGRTILHCYKSEWN